MASGVDADYIAGISIAVLVIMAAVNSFLLVVVRDHVKKLFRVMDGINQRYGRLIDYLEEGRALKRKHGR